MGHLDGSVQARYSHITGEMLGRLMDGLTELWSEALDQRREYCASSPVSVLDALLRAAGERRTGQELKMYACVSVPMIIQISWMHIEMA